MSRLKLNINLYLFFVCIFFVVASSTAKITKINKMNTTTVTTSETTSIKTYSPTTKSNLVKMFSVTIIHNPCADNPCLVSNFYINSKSLNTLAELYPILSMVHVMFWSLVHIVHVTKTTSVDCVTHIQIVIV